MKFIDAFKNIANKKAIMEVKNPIKQGEKPINYIEIDYERKRRYRVLSENATEVECLRCGNKVIVMHSLETVKKYWTCSCER
jgi:hypothetical protein